MKVDKKYMNELLSRPYGQLSDEEITWVQENLTYEMINEWMDATGKAVLITNYTIEPQPAFHVNDLLNLIKK